MQNAGKFNRIRRATKQGVSRPGTIMPPVANSETPSMQDIHNNVYAGINGRKKVMEGGMKLDGRWMVQSLF